MILEADRLGVPARGPGHHRGPVDPGPARAAGRAPGAGRPAARAVPRPALGLHGLAQPLAPPPHASRRRWAPAPSAGCAARSTSTTCGCASGRTSSPSSGRWPSRSGLRPRQRRPRCPDADGIHQALLSGLLSHIGLRDRDRRDYLGARGTRFSIFPGSGLFKSQPDFLMSAELVETSRLWARQNAAIDPVWAEQLGGDLVKPLVLRAALVQEARVRPGPRARHPVRRAAGRRPRRAARSAPARRRPRAVHPARARAGGVAGAPPVLRHQPAAARGGRGARAPRPPAGHRRRRADAVRLLRRAHPGGRRLRRPLRHLVEAGAPHAAGPADLRPRHAGARGRRAGRGRLPRLLARRRRRPAAELPLRARDRGRRRDHRRTPRHAQHARRRPVHLERPRAAPRARHRADPLAAQEAAGQLRAGARRRARFLEAVPPGEEPLPEALSRYLRSLSGVHVPVELWDLDKVPAHLRPTFRVVDDEGEEVANGKDLDALKVPLRPSFDRAMEQVAADSGLSATGQTTWTFGTVEESFVRTRAGHEVRGYPALVDEGATVGLRVVASAGGAGGAAPARRTTSAAAGRALTRVAARRRARQRREARPGGLAVPERPRAGRRLRRRGRGRAGRPGPARPFAGGVRRAWSPAPAPSCPTARRRCCTRSSGSSPSGAPWRSPSTAGSR